MQLGEHYRSLPRSFRNATSARRTSSSLPWTTKMRCSLVRTFGCWSFIAGYPNQLEVCPLELLFPRVITSPDPLMTTELCSCRGNIGKSLSPYNRPLRFTPSQRHHRPAVPNRHRRPSSGLERSEQENKHRRHGRDLGIANAPGLSLRDRTREVDSPPAPNRAEALKRSPFRQPGPAIARRSTRMQIAKTWPGVH